jgi:transposase
VILSRRRPRDIAGKTCKRLALEQLEDLVVIDHRIKSSDIKSSDKELKAMVLASGSTLMDLPGIGPIGAARILADVGDVSRFADRNRFASWTGTAPLDASSGEQTRHRLSRAGNRTINHMLHMAALSQIRLDTDGRAYYRRKRAAGKTHLEALRCLKRRISDAVYRQLLDDTAAIPDASPGGHCGASLTSSAVDSHPPIDTSDQPLPDPRPRRYAAPSRARKAAHREQLPNAG